MSSQRQIDANRENAKKSSGPTSQEGRERSSQQFLKGEALARACQNTSPQRSPSEPRV
jgi:hypothetical protein